MAHNPPAPGPAWLTFSHGTRLRVLRVQCGARTERLPGTDMPAMKPVCLWSGPRNVSTALMYSFAQRPDTRVVDEPLYGHFLRVTGADHPGRDEIMMQIDCDGPGVMDRLLREAADSPCLLFMKQMAHHLVDIDTAFLQRMRNIFLVRDPQQMLPSLTIQLPNATLRDTGLRMQWELYEDLVAAGQDPGIIDSRELLLNPGDVLRQVCAHLDLPYTDAMLSWPAGPRAEDGIWAPYWYHSLHRSTGFAPYVEKEAFPSDLEPLLAECRPWYEKLYACAFRAAKGN